MRFLLVFLLSLPRPAAAELPPGATVRLLSAVTQIAPGIPFEVGIQIHHRPGFHTYWKNPGKVGFATKIDWQLPDGFTAGPLVWPPPERVQMAHHLAHGYHRDVLLTATLTPPPDLAADTALIQARVAWMACAQGCHPGAQNLSMRLPIGPISQPDPATRRDFEQARTRQPPRPDTWQAVLLSPPDARQIDLALRFPDSIPSPLEKPYFFSSDGQIANGSPEVVSSAPGRLTLRFERAEYGPAAGDTLPGILEFGPEAERQQLRLIGRPEPPWAPDTDRTARPQPGSERPDHRDQHRGDDPQ